MEQIYHSSDNSENPWYTTFDLQRMLQNNSKQSKCKKNVSKISCRLHGEAVRKTNKAIAPIWSPQLSHPIDDNKTTKTQPAATTAPVRATTTNPQVQQIIASTTTMQTTTTLLQTTETTPLKILQYNCNNLKHKLQ